MLDYRIRWSLRGRSVVVQAASFDDARDKWYAEVEAGRIHPEAEDCDGYEIDEIEEIEPDG